MAGQQADTPDSGQAEGIFRQARWRTETQNTSLALALVIIGVLIGAMYLAQASRTAAAGRRLQQLEAQREQLEQRNDQLRAEVAALRSVPRLAAEAELRGYRPAQADEVRYLMIEGAAPPAEVSVTAVPDPEALVQPYDETLEGWLLERLSGLRGGAQAFFSVQPLPGTDGSGANRDR